MNDQTAPRTSPREPGRPRWARLRRAREVLAVVLLTVLVVAATTLVHHAHVRRVLLQDAVGQAQLVARQTFDLISRVAIGGHDPAEAIRRDPDIRALVDASVTYAPHLLYVSIVDAEGRVLVHSDPRWEGQMSTPRPDFRNYVALDPIRRLYDTYRGDEIYEVGLPMDLDRRPFGAIKVGIAMPLVRAELRAALAQSALLGGLALVAAVAVAVWLSQVAMRRVRRLADAMERLRQGDFEVSVADGPTDEFGKLAYQLQILGREIQTDRLRLRTERAQFQSAVNQIEDGVLFVGADRRIMFANQAMAPALGRPVAEATGVPLDEALPRGHPLRQTLEQAMGGGDGLRNATMAIPGEDRGDFLISVFPVDDARAGGRAAIAVLKDFRSLAVSVRTLQSLIRYSAQLTGLGRATSAIAHDVKNPLNAMMIHLELVGERLGPAASPAVRESLGVLRAEVERLDGIVQRFLQLVKPQDVSLNQLDLNAVIEDVAGLLEPEWKARGVSFAKALAPDLPSVLGDADLLRRAFMNILVNGCEAMPEGGVLSLTSEREAGGDFVRVTVTDSGAGIAPRDLEKVFTLYYTTKGQGSGIGLPLAQRIIDVHGGSIDLRSEAGRGTTVVVRLPLG